MFINSSIHKNSNYNSTSIQNTISQQHQATTIDTFMYEPLPIVSLLIAACFIGVFANGFVCYLILNVQRLKTVTNVFVFSLCLCDIIFAGVLIPTHCFFQMVQQGLFYQFLTVIAVLIYILNLAFTTFERLISITRPMEYFTRMTKSKAVCYVIFCWTLPLVYGCAPLCWNVNTQLLVHKIFLVFTLVIFLMIPFVFIAYVYIHICMEINRINAKDPHCKGRSTSSNKSKNSATHQKSCNEFASCFVRLVVNHEKAKGGKVVTDIVEENVEPCEVDPASYSSFRSASSSSSSKKMSSKKQKRATKKNKRKEIRASLPFALTTLMYMFTWLPVIYLTTLDIIDRLDLAPLILSKLSIFAIVLNTVTVPFIYGLLLPDFRFTLKRMFAKRRLKTSS